MPAETHQHVDGLDRDAILDLLAALVDVDRATADAIALVALEIDNELTILDLWVSVVEEFGERSVGDLSLSDECPTTLGELAALFRAALRPGAQQGLAPGD